MTAYLLNVIRYFPAVTITACCLYLSPVQATLQSSSLYNIQAIPGWVKPIAPAVAKEDDDVVRGGQRYLLVDRQFRDNGEQVALFKRYVTDVVGQSGLSDASKLSITFDPSYEKLQLHTATVLRNGKKSDRLANARIDVARTEDSSEQDLFLGQVTALVVFSDIRVGDQVEVSYTVVGRNPVLDPRHHSSWRTRWTVPVQRSLLRITVPQGMALAHTPRPAAVFSEETRAGLRTLQWQWEAQSALEIEKNTTRWYVDSGRMEVSAFRNWDEVAEWGAGLFVGHSTQGESFRRLSKSIKQTADEKGLQPAIAEAIDHVQKRIRYYGIELGENSHRPHSPDEVLKNGYGDCKDKALLLVSLLDELGVSAWPLLVSSRNRKGIVDQLPSPGAFDHAIVLIEHNGEQYWVDATDNSQSGLLGFRGQPEYGAALVLGKSGTALITRKAPMPKQPTVSKHDSFYISSFNGPVDLVTTSTYRGFNANAVRYYLDDLGKRQFEKNHMERYQRDYGKLRMLDKMEIKHNDVENTITLTSSFRLSKFWDVHRRYQQAGFNTYAFAVADELDEFEDISEDREAPLPVARTRWVTHRIQYYPNIASTARALEESNFEIDGFAYHDSEYVMGDSKVFESELKITAEEISIDQLKEYNKFRNRVLRNIRDGRFYKSLNKDDVENGKAMVTLLNELGELSQ